MHLIQFIPSHLTVRQWQHFKVVSHTFRVVQSYQCFLLLKPYAIPTPTITMLTNIQ